MSELVGSHLGARFLVLHNLIYKHALVAFNRSVERALLHIRSFSGELAFHIAEHRYEILRESHCDSGIDWYVHQLGIAGKVVGFAFVVCHKLLALLVIANLILYDGADCRIAERHMACRDDFVKCHGNHLVVAFIVVNRRDRAGFCAERPLNFLAGRLDAVDLG